MNIGDSMYILGCLSDVRHCFSCNVPTSINTSVLNMSNVILLLT